MTLPETGKSITISAIGDPSVLTLSQTPVPKNLEPGTALIHNTHAGLNYIDTYFRIGLYSTPLPTTLGREGAGSIAAINPTATSPSFQVGDRVAYLGTSAYAEYTVVPISSLVRVPGGITDEQAAAVLLQGLTAWTFIREAGNVQAGQWTLVHAAAGGVGGLLVQLLKSVGAKVVGTASSEEKRKIVTSYGADAAIDSKGDWVKESKAATGGLGFDVIFDGVGKDTFEGDFEVIARKGTLISFGNASGAVPPLSLLRLMPKNVKLLRPNVSGYTVEREELETYSEELFAKVLDGSLKVPIHKVYDLKDAASAHQDIESRTTVGKLVLKI